MLSSWFSGFGFIVVAGIAFCLMLVSIICARPLARWIKSHSRGA